MNASDLAELREFLSLDDARRTHRFGLLRRLFAREEPFDLAGEARRLGASGIIVWLWNEDIDALTPAMTHGYPERVLAQLPAVGRDADNATALAFRSGKMSAVAGVRGATSALAAPIVADLECIGVLAVELPNGAEKDASTRAAVTVMAARVMPSAEARRREGRYERSVPRRA